jgi:hypothetical protein
MILLPLDFSRSRSSVIVLGGRGFGLTHGADLRPERIDVDCECGTQRGKSPEEVALAKVVDRGYAGKRESVPSKLQIKSAGS